MMEKKRCFVNIVLSNDVFTKMMRAKLRKTYGRIRFLGKKFTFSLCSKGERGRVLHFYIDSTLQRRTDRMLQF